MSTDWGLVVSIAVPVITLFLGIWLEKKFENKARLISYFSHVSSFTYTQTNGQQATVYTHSVILKNTGRKAATNVRLSHSTLPDFNIWPAIRHNVEAVANGVQDIVIPSLVPGEQITISYLYFPPTTVNEINAGIKHGEGFAKPINVLLQRQYPQWVNYTVAILLLIGIVTFLYILFKISAWVFL